MKTYRFWLASMLAAASPLLHAQTANWPDHPIKIIVPFAPGAFTDASARLLARELTEQLGQQVLVENKTGAGGVIGTDAVAKARPDGYTLLVAETSYAITPVIKSKLPFDPLKSLQPISQIAEATAVLMARGELPARTLGDMVALARQKPKSLSFGSAGLGSSSHLPVEFFMSIADIDLLHVPYKGASQSIQELVGGQIDLVFSSVATGAPHIATGRVRGLAVTGTERSPVLPDVPTFAEAGYPNYKMTYWFGVFAPAETPRPIVDRLNQAIREALAKQRLHDAFVQQGAKPVSSSPEEFSRFVAGQVQLWRDVAVRAKVPVE